MKLFAFMTYKIWSGDIDRSSNPIHLCEVQWVFYGTLETSDIDPLIMHSIDTVIIWSNMGLVCWELAHFHDVGDLFLYFVGQNLTITFIQIQWSLKNIGKFCISFFTK